MNARRHGILNWRSWTLAGVVMLIGGCVTQQGRDYGHLLFSPDDYFQIQVVDSNGISQSKVWVDTVLLLPPIGNIPRTMVNDFELTLWQELQQLLPGRVQRLRTHGLYAKYADAQNLVGDDGKVVDAEVARLGTMASASHVLLPQIIDYSPYHPQRIVMEWRLVDCRRQQMVLVVIGGLDISEQRVLQHADSYLRDRKAIPYNNDNLGMLLRSPREFSGFAVAQGVGVLKGRIVPVTVVPFKVQGDIDDKFSNVMELE